MANRNIEEEMTGGAIIFVILIMFTVIKTVIILIPALISLLITIIKYIFSIISRIYNWIVRKYQTETALRNIKKHAAEHGSSMRIEYRGFTPEFLKDKNE